MELKLSHFSILNFSITKSDHNCLRVLSLMKGLQLERVNTGKMCIKRFGSNISVILEGSGKQIQNIERDS